MNLARLYSAEIDSTIDRLVLLHNLFYRPVAVINDKGQVVKMEWVWATPEAERICKFLYKHLENLTEKQHEILNKENTHEP